MLPHGAPWQYGGGGQLSSQIKSHSLAFSALIMWNNAQPLHVLCTVHVVCLCVLEHVACCAPRVRVVHVRDSICNAPPIHAVCPFDGPYRHMHVARGLLRGRPARQAIHIGVAGSWHVAFRSTWRQAWK